MATTKPSGDPLPLWRLPRRICFIALVLLTAGCTKLVYNRLDTVAGLYLGSLVSLDAEQRGDLRQWLAQMLDWHRSSELGRYAAFVHQLSEQSASPGNRARYRETEAQLDAFAEAVAIEASPEAVRLLTGLSDAQLDELDANLEKRARENAAKSQKAIDKGVWARDRGRDIQQQLKRWTGAATDAQRAAIAETAAQFEPTAGEWVDSQRRWRRLLIDASRARPLDEQRILQLLRTPDAHWTSAYSTKNERNRDRSLALLEKLDASLTPAQRARLQRELRELAEQLEELKES